MKYNNKNKSCLLFFYLFVGSLRFYSSYAWTRLPSKISLSSFEKLVFFLIENHIIFTLIRFDHVIYYLHWHKLSIEFCKISLIYVCYIKFKCNKIHSEYIDSFGTVIIKIIKVHTGEWVLSALQSTQRWNIGCV